MTAREGGYGTGTVATMVACLGLTLAPVQEGWAQDPNFMFPIPTIEEMLQAGDVQIIAMNPSRGLEGERTYQATCQIGDQIMQVKYAPAEKGADDFNNRPAYEVAAYEIQKLFLDADEYVVPPTVVRPFPTDRVQAALSLTGSDLTPAAEPTFGEWRMTLVVLQYWMFNVETPEDLRDDDRIEADPAYERHLGNFNLLTYLIRHNDSNVGNFLRSLAAENPRVFSVDNGVAFSREESDRGTYWRELRLDRYPAETVERLRQYTLEDLYDRLGVLAQFEVRGGQFVRVPPGENMDPGEGVWHDDTTVQVGLTDREIRNVNRRLEQLLEWVDEGRYEVYP